MRTAGNRHQLVVRSINARSARGWLELGALRIPCALGRSGRSVLKREGDGASPVGQWPLREGYFRAGHIRRPKSALPLRAIKVSDGWCDASTDPNYNRKITHPYPASAEHLWRSDGLYDLVVVLGFNDGPRKRGRGSAIFLHCARENFAPTEGCIAVGRSDLIKLLAWLSPAATIRI
jgi:L,D-peptidoglycan transpeptidase YkuD (ErfK/YbiS/YcfS/YnhG family)